MKYCEEYAALLDLFVDGELAGPEMERVRDHLSECPGCRAYVDDALAIRAGFPDVEETAVPEGFAGGVMERIREASAKDRKIVELKRRGVRRWLGTAAALAACCALVILVRTGNGAAVPTGGDRGADYSSYNNGPADGAADVIGGEEAGIALQAAPESKEEPAESAPEEAQAAPVVRSKAAELYNDEEALKAAPAEAAPEAAMDSGQFSACPSAPEEQPALCLTAEEAGDLLDGFTVVWENAVEWRYKLSREEYQTLLEALGRQEELPETEEGPFLVAVSGPLE
nr:anti-sigma factor [uncultured Oscillibacter sp.]